MSTLHHAANDASFPFSPLEGEMPKACPGYDTGAEGVLVPSVESIRAQCILSDRTAFRLLRPTVRC